MSSQVSRNDPCPCGSGLKYKKCCLGKAFPLRGRRLLWTLIPFVGAIVAAIIIGIFFGLKSGFGAGAALLLLSGVLFVVRGAPASRSTRSGPSDINFGR